MRILHVFRAPVGGLFRHVRDLVRGQAGLGHEVGIVCDSTSGDALSDRHLAEASNHCRLGIHKIAMSRLPGAGDISSANAIAAKCRALNPDIVHGHGAKGGVYARLAAGRLGAKAVYTPHGGVLHYNWASAAGAVYLSAEKLMLAKTHGLVFVCKYERDLFADKLGFGRTKQCVVHNGLWQEEFNSIALEPDASDIIFVGELRALKGVDELLEALVLVKQQTGKQLSATITGSGPEEVRIKQKTIDLGLVDHVRFTGALPARTAFAKGWLMVIPSRAESFPYIVLEAIAAEKPLLATNVGGISEVLDAAALAAPNDAADLARHMIEATSNRDRLDDQARQLALNFRANMSASQMSKSISDFYTSLA